MIIATEEELALLKARILALKAPEDRNGYAWYLVRLRRWINEEKETWPAEAVLGDLVWTQDAWEKGVDW